MTSHFDPFGARRGQWSLIRLAEDEWALYVSGRRNAFGTALAARGTRSEIDALIDRSCLV